MNDKFYIELLERYLSVHNIDRKELAKRLNVSGANISNWLNGIHGITLKNRKAIEFVCSEFIERDNNGNIIKGNGVTGDNNTQNINSHNSNDINFLPERNGETHQKKYVAQNLLMEKITETVNMEVDAETKIKFIKMLLGINIK